MTVYTKTMAQALREVYLVEDNMEQMRKAAGGAMQTIKFRDGKLKVDSFTASAIMKVYDAVNSKNKKSMENIINKGTKSQMMKLQSFAMKQIKSELQYAAYDPENKGPLATVDEHSNGKPHKHPHDDEEDEDEIDQQQQQNAQEAAGTVNLKSPVMLDLLRLYNKAMSVPPGSKKQKEYKKEIEKVRKSMGMTEDISVVVDTEELTEGTWHIAKDMSGLKMMMKKPIKLGNEGDDATEVVSPFIGDDQLYDALYASGKKNPNGDARPVIKKAMKRLKIKEEVELDEGIGKFVAKKVGKAALGLAIPPLVKGVAKGAAVGAGIAGGKHLYKKITGQDKKKKEEVELDERSPERTAKIDKARGGISGRKGGGGAGQARQMGVKTDHQGRGLKKTHKPGDKGSYGTAQARSGDAETGKFSSMAYNKRRGTSDPKLQNLRRKHGSGPGGTGKSGRDMAGKKLAASFSPEEIENFDMIMNEGTWKVPETRIDQMALRKTLRKPIKAKDAEKVMSQHIGDDSLYDEFAELEKDDPNQDVRPLIKTRMKELGIKEEVELDEKENSYTVVHVKKGKEVVKAKSSYEAAKKFAQMKGLKNTSGVDAHLMEEVELDEAKYDLYHKDFSSAMQHAYAMAKKLHGITIDPKEIDDKVATGPSKPGSGKTNTYRLKGDKGSIQVQVYNKGGSKPFELNMYKEEVDLGEAVLPFTKVLKKNKKLVKYVDSKKMPFYIMIDNEQLDKLGETNSQFLFDKLKKNKGLADVGERDVSFHFKTEKDVRGFKSDLYFANSGGRYGKLELNHYTDSFYFDEEVELDEGTFKDIITMKKGNVGVGVIANAANVKKMEKDGWKIEGVIEKGSKILHKDPKRIMKAIKGGDKLGIGEGLDDKDTPTVKKVVKMLNKASKAHAGQAKDLEKAVKEDLDEARQLKDPKKEMMVKSKDSGVIVIDKKDFKKYQKKGYFQVEEVELDEGKMNQMNQMMQDGKSAEQIAKALKLDLTTVRELMKEGLGKLAKAGVKAVARKAKKVGKAYYDVTPIGMAHRAGKAGIEKAKDVYGRVKRASKTGEEFDPVEEGAAADARRAIGRDPQLGRKKDSADDDMSATDDDVKAASKNIMMQLRKSQTLRGKFDVEFMDRKKHKVPSKVAQAVTARYMALKRPTEKQEFQNKISKSYKDMLKALDEAINNEGFIFVHKKQTILERIDGKLMERKNG